jgi:predicted nicotinamide N-methyase
MYSMQTTDNIFGASNIVTVQLPSKGLSFKLWPAALHLCEYLEAHRAELNLGSMHVLEIGAGCGLVGICAVKLGAKRVTITDMLSVVPLIDENLAANDLNNKPNLNISGAALDWIQVSDAYDALLEADKLVAAASKKLKRKTPTPTDDEQQLDQAVYEQAVAHQQASAAALNNLLPDNPSKDPVLVVASDVIYHENLFEPLLNTIIALTIDQSTPCRILLAHERRRKIESRFFKPLAKHFDVTQAISHSDNTARHKHIDIFTIMRKSPKPCGEQKKQYASGRG